MDKTVFFILGPVLVVSALALAGVGLRREDFPSKGEMIGVIGVFVALVLGTTTFAVLNAQSEPLGDENKQAAKVEQAQGQETGVQEADQPEPGAAGAAAPPAQSQAPAGAAAALKVSSPSDGSLKFDPATLDAKAGTVTIDYDNPSPVPHDIAIAGSNGQILDQTEPAAMKTFTVSADLKPGTYAFYCTVPGHREAGMEGKLTVK